MAVGTDCTCEVNLVTAVPRGGTRRACAPSRSISASLWSTNGRPATGNSAFGSGSAGEGGHPRPEAAGENDDGPIVTGVDDRRRALVVDPEADLLEAERRHRVAQVRPCPRRRRAGSRHRRRRRACRRARRRRYRAGSTRRSRRARAPGARSYFSCHCRVSSAPNASRSPRSSAVVVSYPIARTWSRFSRSETVRVRPARACCSASTSDAERRTPVKKSSEVVLEPIARRDA